ncbi:MAG: ABC transporter permease subunit [Candidatus Omnitrophica bacterium]|nr:ABC transporter permease subunit [Candidatus Omnitrophota bacterium]
MTAGQTAAALLLLYGAWWLTSRLTPWPSPQAVFQVLGSNLHTPHFQAALLGSLRRMVMGYALVVVIGIGGGLLLGRIPLVDHVLGSFAVAIHAIPGAAWVPLSILWFGMTERAVIFTIVLGAAGVVIVSTDTGIREIPPLIARAAKTLGASGARYFWFVVVPAAIPKIVDGLRLAWAFGWRALMAGELFTSVHGLGGLLNQVVKTQDMTVLLALMTLIAGIGIGVDALFKGLQHRVWVRWGLV